LPKSITAAIAIGVAEEYQGIVTITVAAVIITGITGNVIAEPVCKFFRIKNPIAKGIAIGTSSHVVGTSKAMEMGEVEGAMSSLAIVVAGLTTNSTFFYLDLNLCRLYKIFSFWLINRLIN
jgi:putative effector of murein hydrolase